MTIVPGTRLNHYEVLSRIGSGGMGEVYLANDSRLDRKVALKLLPASAVADEQARKRLLREARAAATLDHPNICGIHEVGEQDGLSFIVMQYVEGETLADRIHHKPLELGEVLDVAAQVSDALAEAHSRGIIHRDIKPANIMLGARGQAKVMDFGLAKALRDRDVLESEAETLSLLTKPGMIIGTVPYMSAEQVRGEPLDGRSDIFSFGAVLYEMVSGRQPFAAESAAATASAILTKEPLPLARYAPDTPAELQRIVGKCLEKDREQRYQSARDLTIDLRNLKRNIESGPAVVAMGGVVKWRTHLSSRRRLAFIGVAVLAIAALTYALFFRGGLAPLHPDIKSLAVLPLRSLDAGENYLGLGIADAVIRRISQTGELIVRPTSAVRRYLNEETDGLLAANQLGVDSVLEGTVQRADDRLRVSVNLLRTSDGVSLWAENFDMHTADVFTIQDTIGQQVASRLKLKLNPAQQARFGKRYTSNPEAYEYYVKGRANLEHLTTSIGDRQAIEAAITHFKKAIELDSKYALAHAVLGNAYMWMANFTDPDNPVWVKLAQQALSQAESLDPQLAEIHSARTEYYFSAYGGWNLTLAAREARQALALNPSVGHLELGRIYDHLGLDETTGLKEFQRALEIDPTNTFTQNRMIESYLLYGKFDDAVDAYRRFFGTTGPDIALVAKGRLDEAQRLVEDAVKKNSGDLRARARLALIFALRNKFQEAEAAIRPILDQARNNRGYHHMTYDIACIYALDGKVDETIKWLRTTADTGMPNYPLFERDPYLDRVRKETAFIRFMTEMRTRWEGYRRELDEGATR